MEPVSSRVSWCLGAHHLPEGEDEREDEDPGDGKTLTNLVRGIRIVLGKDHDQYHIDDESNRGPGQRETPSGFVDVCQTDGVRDCGGF